MRSRLNLSSLFIAGLIIITIGCDYEPSETDTWIPDSLITATNEIGIILSIDENDWGYDGQYEVGDTIPFAMTEDGSILTKYKVLHPYPNPSQSDTITFYYRLPEFSHVYLYLFNTAGDTLVINDQMQVPGNYMLQYDVALLRAGYYHCVFNFESDTIEGDILVDTATTSISKRVSESF